MKTKRLPKPLNETKLQRTVRYWLNSRGADYQDGWKGAYKDLEYGGCRSGMVGKLVYYTDTVRFYKRHREEIGKLLSEAIDESGVGPDRLFGKDYWDTLDPLATQHTNQNLLAWFAFEETARQIAYSNGYDN